MLALPNPENHDAGSKIDSGIFRQHSATNHDTGKRHAGGGGDLLAERANDKHQSGAPEKQQRRVGGHDETAKADGGKHHPQHRAPASGSFPIEPPRGLPDHQPRAKMKPGGGNPYGPALMPEQPMGESDNPAGHRWFCVIPKIEILAPQPVLCLINTQLQRCGEKGERAQQSHPNKSDQHISVMTARQCGGGNRCSFRCVHWVSLLHLLGGPVVPPSPRFHPASDCKTRRDHKNNRDYKKQ